MDSVVISYGVRILGCVPYFVYRLPSKNQKQSLRCPCGPLKTNCFKIRPSLQSDICVFSDRKKKYITGRRFTSNEEVNAEIKPYFEANSYRS